MEKKEAMKILKDFYDKSALFSVRTALDTIIPELKENEDEKIRKDIIWCLKHSGIKDNSPINPHVTTIKRDAIAWLEKQSEKPQGKSALEAINEEKVDNANKIEPKFHEGDWIVNTITNDVEQIIEVTSNEYICTGLLIVSFENQHLLKKWTIEDAKDGDILVEKKSGRPFIFKGLLDVNHPKCPIAYCGIDMEYKFISEPCYKNRWTDDEVCPATKEQRNALMKAMTDAGYIFDFEKKELKMLKNIEQKDIWKPSTEQIMAFEHFVRSIGESGYTSPYDNDIKLIYSLLLDLKKLKE